MICAIEMNSATWVLSLVWKVIEVVWLNRLEFLLSQVFYSMKGIKVELCVCGFWRLNKVYMWYELFHEKMMWYMSSTSVGQNWQRSLWSICFLNRNVLVGNLWCTSNYMKYFSLFKYLSC